MYLTETYGAVEEGYDARLSLGLFKRQLRIRICPVFVIAFDGEVHIKAIGHKYKSATHPIPPTSRERNGNAYSSSCMAHGLPRTELSNLSMNTSTLQEH